MALRRERKPTAGRKHIQTKHRPVVELHPMVFDIALGAVIVAVISIWLTFGQALEIDYLLAVVSLFTIVFFTIFLLTTSYVARDPRWRQRRTSFVRFLKNRVAVLQSHISGREALLQITLLPVMLALGFAAIGLIWVVLH